MFFLDVAMNGGLSIWGACMPSVQVRVPFHKELRSITSLGKFLRQKCPSPHFDTYEKLNHEKAILERWKLRCIAA